MSILESQKDVKQIEVLLNLKQKILFSTLNLLNNSKSKFWENVCVFGISLHSNPKQTVDTKSHINICIHPQ